MKIKCCTRCGRIYFPTDENKEWKKCPSMFAEGINQEDLKFADDIRICNDEELEAEIEWNPSILVQFSTGYSYLVCNGDLIEREM